MKPEWQADIDAGRCILVRSGNVKSEKKNSKKVI